MKHFIIVTLLSAAIFAYGVEKREVSYDNQIAENISNEVYNCFNKILSSNYRT